MNIKFLLLFLIFCISFTGFSQSAKKQYKANLAQFEALKKQYDSIYGSYNVINKNYTEALSILIKKRNNIVKDGSELKSKFLHEFEKASSTLKLLKDTSFNLNSKTYSDEIDTLLKNNKSVFYAIYQKDSLFKTINWQNADTSLRIDKMNYKQKNQLLEEKIKNMTICLEQNREICTKLKEKQIQLTQILPSLNVVFHNISIENQKLNKLIEDMNATIEKYHINYLENGPKGFDPVYKTIFSKPEAGLYILDPAENAEPATKEYAPEPAVDIPLSKDTPHTFVDTEACFPGGKEAMKTYFSNNLKLPDSVINYGIKGKVLVSFVIKYDGSVSNVEIKKGIPGCYECTEAVIEMLLSMPNWIPAKHEGENVSQLLQIPISINMNGSK